MFNTQMLNVKLDQANVQITILMRTHIKERCQVSTLKRNSKITLKCCARKTIYKEQFILRFYWSAKINITIMRSLMKCEVQTALKHSSNGFKQVCWFGKNV